MNVSRFRYKYFLLFILFTPLPSFGASYIYELNPDSLAVVLGLGWDSLAEQKTSANCVVAKTHTIGGQVKKEKLGIVTDTESWSKQKNETYKAAYGGGVFEAEGSYTTNSLKTFSQSDTYIAVLASVSNGPSFLVPTNLDITKAVAVSEIMAPPRNGSIESGNAENEKTALAELFTNSTGTIKLQGWAQQLISKGDFKEFYRVCGDGFISEVHAGAKINARMVVHDTDANTKNDVGIKLSGSGWGASASATISEIETTTKAHHSLGVDYDQQGGEGGNFPEPTPAGLLSALSILPTVAAEHPSPLMVRITPYADIAGWPANTAGMRTSKIERLSKEGLRLSRLWADIEAIKVVPMGKSTYRIIESDDHCVASKTELAKLQDSVFKQITLINENIKKCETDAFCEINSNLEFDELYARNMFPETKERDSQIMYSQTKTIDEYSIALATSQSNLWVRPILEERLKFYNERYENQRIQDAIDKSSLRLSTCYKGLNLATWPIYPPKPPTFGPLVQELP